MVVMNLDLNELKMKVKQIALDLGAKVVGIGSRDRLKDAPPSGNMDFCLPGAQSCIIWAYPNPIEVLKNYFSKKERMSFKKQQFFAYTTAWKTAKQITDFIEKHSAYKAYPVVPNGQYRKGNSLYSPANILRIGLFLLKIGIGKNVIVKRINQVLGPNPIYPPFSLRIGGVAAGLGHLGWSGNLFINGFGASHYLGGVLITAPLESDPLPEETGCNQCKICVKTCTTGFFSLTEKDEPLIIAGKEEIHAKRNAYTRCDLGCGGWAGLSEDGTWSIWSPNHECLKKIPEEDIVNNATRLKMIKKIFFPKENLKLAKFNKIILESFMKVGVNSNVALRSLEDTNPRCGFCSAICVADYKQRKELFNMLKQSGKVYIKEDGTEYVELFDDDGEKIIYNPPMN